MPILALMAVVYSASVTPLSVTSTENRSERSRQLLYRRQCGSYRDCLVRPRTRFGDRKIDLVGNAAPEVRLN